MMGVILGITAINYIYVKNDEFRNSNAIFKLRFVISKLTINYKQSYEI